MANRVSAVLLALAGALSGCRESDFGSSELPPCRVDSDCADTSGCNGEERCTAGRCESSEAVVCPAEMVCADRGTVASCEFVPQSPWLIFTDDVEPGFYGMFGLPTALAGKVEPFDLNANISSEDYIGVASNEWSPNGRYMLFDPTRYDFSTRLYWMEFGRGLPTEGRPVEDLPNSGVWSVLSWSADSRRVVLEEYESEERYQLDFSGGQPRSSRLAGASRAVFCGAGILYQLDSSQIHWAGDFGDSNSESMGTGEFTIFPDREHVLITDESGASSFSKCDHDAVRYELENASWVGLSADSNFVAFEARGGLAVVAVDDAREVYFVEDVNDADGWAWADGGARLLVTDVFDTGKTLQLIDIRAGAVVAEASIDAELAASWLGPNLVLLAPSDAIDRDLSVWPLSGEPIRLDACDLTRGVIGSEDGSTVVCVQSDETEGSRVFAIDVALGGHVRELWRDRSPDAELEGFSHDGSHVLVQSTSSAEATLIHLWWVPVQNGVEEAPVQINRGNFATTWSPWQPTP
jgi:hypothetical protein